MWAGIHIISKYYLRRLLSTALGIHKVNYPREIPTATRCGGREGNLLLRTWCRIVIKSMTYPDHAHLTPGGGRPSKVMAHPTPKDVYKLLGVRGPTPKDVYKLLGVRGPRPPQRMCTNSWGTLGKIWEFDGG